MTAIPITSNQMERFDDIIAGAKRRALKEVGPDRDGMQRLFGRSGEFDDAFVALVRRLMAHVPDYALARSILGGDFIPPEEIMTARPGIIYADEQIKQLAESMPSEEDLRWCKNNGYALMAAPPHGVALLNVRMLESNLFYSKTGGWYADARETFATQDKTSFGWLAIRKTPVPKSTSKNWAEQSGLLSDVERVPNAGEITWFVTTFFKVRGVRLFERIYVRTSSLGSGGGRVYVGDFGARGLLVDDDWSDDRGSDLGLSSARK